MTCENCPQFFTQGGGIFRRDQILMICTISGNDTNLRIRFVNGETSGWVFDSQEDRDASLAEFKRILVGDEKMLTLVPGQPGEDDKKDEEIERLRNKVTELETALDRLISLDVGDWG